MIISRFDYSNSITSQIFTLSLHDALPISTVPSSFFSVKDTDPASAYLMVKLALIQTFMIVDSGMERTTPIFSVSRSEEHTSELQSPCKLICRLLREKKQSCNRHLTRLTTT